MSTIEKKPARLVVDILTIIGRFLTFLTRRSRGNLEESLAQRPIALDHGSLEMAKFRDCARARVVYAQNRHNADLEISRHIAHNSDSTATPRVGAIQKFDPREILYKMA